MTRNAGIIATTAVALTASLGSGAVVAENVSSAAAAKLLFGFENGPQGWGIPDWALEKPDLVAKEVHPVQEGATEGQHALGVVVDFPGGQWNGAIVEIEEYFDWSPYHTLAADVTLPADAPAGLKAKLILVVGEDWAWTEMRRAIQLTPGQTTTLTANLAAGSEDWKRTEVNDSFRKDVRKLAIRLESNKPAFQGTFTIDNVRLE